MKANTFFRNVHHFDVKRFEVALGEEFTIELEGSSPEWQWFSNADPVLSIDVNQAEQTAKVKALKKGPCTVAVVSNSFEKLLELTITVFDAGEAVTLNASAGAPVLK